MNINTQKTLRVKRKLIFLLFILIPSQVQAWMGFDIGIIFQKGVGKNFTLESEVYARMVKYPGQSMVVKTKNGIVVKMDAEFSDGATEYGPGRKIHVVTNLSHYLSENQISNRVFEFDIALNQKKEFSFKEADDQVIKIIVTPKIF